MLDVISDLWGADLSIEGKTAITFFVFNILFMLIGRFRFSFISSLVLLYYLFFFANKEVIERSFSSIGGAGMTIGSGAVFIALGVWSFFIDSD